MATRISDPRADFRRTASRSCMLRPPNASLLGEAVIAARSVRLLMLAFLFAGTLTAGSGTATISSAASGASAQVAAADDSAPFRPVIQAAGWNLVAWTGDTPVADATASIAGAFARLFTFDAATQAFRFFGGGGSPTSLNTLDELRLGDGVWIFAEEPTVWPQPVFRGAHSVPLLAGANLAAWTGPSGTPVEDALAAILDRVELAATFDADGQTFLTFGPTSPAAVNTLTTLDHGVGIWLLLSAEATWEQPSVPTYGVQDVWLIHRIVRQGGGGEEDLTADVLGDALAAPGPPVPLRFGVTFREAANLGGVIRDANGERMPWISLTFGVLSRGADFGDGVVVNSVTADAFLGGADQILVAFSSPRVDQVPRNLGEQDTVSLDVGSLDLFDVGDTVTIDMGFAQLLRPAAPQFEDGLTPLEIFAGRWDAAAMQLFGTETDEGSTAPAIATLTATVEVGNAASAALRAAGAGDNLKWFGKGMASAGLVGLTVVTAGADIPVIALIAAGVGITGTGAGLIAVNIEEEGAEGGTGGGGPPPERDQAGPEIEFRVLASGCNTEVGFLRVLVIISDVGGVASASADPDTISGDPAVGPTGNFEEPMRSGNSGRVATANETFLNETDQTEEAH